MMNFRCKFCGFVFEHDSSLCGARISCPQCASEFVAYPLVILCDDAIEQGEGVLSVSVPSQQVEETECRSEDGSTEDECIVLSPARQYSGAAEKEEDVIVLEPLGRDKAEKGVFAAALEEVIGASSENNGSDSESTKVGPVPVMSVSGAGRDAQVVVYAGEDVEFSEPDTQDIDEIEESLVDGLMADIELEMAESDELVATAVEDKCAAAENEAQSILVPDGLPLAEVALANVGTPRGIAFDGVLVRSVNSWKDCYLAFCEKLMAIDMSKFDDFPKNPFLKRFFIRALPNKKYPDCYAVHCGTAGDVRIKVLNAGFYFYKPKYVVSQLLELYGIDPARVAIKV